MKLAGLALWAVALLLSNLLVYRFSPHPRQISGNGFHPMQFMGMIGSVVCAVGLMWAEVRSVARLSRSMLLQVRLLAIPGGLITSAVLLWLSWTSFRHFETTTAYFRAFGPNHRWGLINQYTVAYWATSWRFWLGVLGVGATTGIVLGDRRDGRKTQA